MSDPISPEELEAAASNKALDIGTAWNLLDRAAQSIREAREEIDRLKHPWAFLNEDLR